VTPANDPTSRSRSRTTTPSQLTIAAKSQVAVLGDHLGELLRTNVSGAKAIEPVNPTLPLRQPSGSHICRWHRVAADAAVTVRHAWADGCVRDHADVRVLQFAVAAFRPG
jgi:hypothetical protein